MKLKLDENLPETLVDTLSALGHDVDTVRGNCRHITASPLVDADTETAETVSNQ